MLVEKFTDFEEVRSRKENKVRQTFKLLNIVYNVEKHFKQKMNCYFTDKLHLAYRVTFLLEKVKLNIQMLSVLSVLIFCGQKQV